MILAGEFLQLVPFQASYGSLLKGWFYDEAYQYMFRHFPKILKDADFSQYPNIIGGEVFLIVSKVESGGAVIGFVQLIPDCKANRGAYVGILLDKDYQKKGYAASAFYLLFDYAFNRLGHRKLVIEIIANDDNLKRIVETAKFRFEGRLFEEAFIEGFFYDELRYSMTDRFFNKTYKPEGKPKWADS